MGYSLENRVKRALSTKDKSVMPVFCVMKDKVRCIVTDISRTVFLVITQPDDDHCVEVSKEDALALIKMYGLVPQKKTDAGTVYDTIDRQFREKYRGFQVRLT